MGTYNSEDYQAYMDFLNHRKPKEKESEKYYKGDMHIHSKYSWDSEMDIATIVENAERNKLKYVGIADHVDFGNEATLDVIDRIKRRNEEIDKLQESTDVRILKGLEVGEPHLYLDEMEYLKRIPDLDYTIGSIHFIKRKSLGALKCKDRINKYYLEMLRMVKEGNFDILGHMDYIKKYFEVSSFDEDLLYQILETIKAKNVALEINTGGIRRCGEEYPSKKILDIYEKEKGNKITYGSDAHEESELFTYIKETSESQKIYKLSPGVIINHKFKQI